MFLVPQSVQLLGDIFDSDIRECCSICTRSVEASDFRGKTFNQVANSHSRWNSVRIDDEIWRNTLAGERHILSSIGHTDSTFLSMPGSKFVSDLWYSDRPCSDFYEFLSILILGDEDSIDNSFLIMSHW
jgi:hypothetical protein